MEAHSIFQRMKAKLVKFSGIENDIPIEVMLKIVG
mgnify:CR=1 FL=1